MPTLRRSIGTDVMSLPPNDTVPPSSGSSRPAIMRSIVVLPQPKGPSSHLVTHQLPIGRFDRPHPFLGPDGKLL